MGVGGWGLGVGGWEFTLKNMAGLMRAKMSGGTKIILKMSSSEGWVGGVGGVGVAVRILEGTTGFEDEGLRG